MPDDQLTGRVITVSDRCAAGTAADHSGPLARALLAAHGVVVDPVRVVPDDPQRITEALRDAVDAQIDVVLLTGGTGIGPRDVTPDVVAGLLDKLLPGIPEAIRAASRAAVPPADLARPIAGVTGGSLVLALPGAPDAVRAGLAVAGPLLGHAAAMLRGADHGDHPAGGHTAGRRAAGHRTDGLRLDGERVGRVVRCEITPSVLDPDEHEKAVSGPGTGAVVSFVGSVRDHDGGRAVSGVDCQAHPSAEAVLAEAARGVLRAVPGVQALAVSHRVGSLRVGEVILVVAVAAAHRAAAFAACTRLVEEIKSGLPVWKHQAFSDGTDEWVGCRL